MGKQFCYGFQGLNCSFGASWQIQDQGFASYSAYCAAQGGEWRLFESFTAHAFRYARQKTIANRHCGFWGDIAKGEAGSAGSRDQLHFAGKANEKILDFNGIVGDDLAHSYGETKFLE